MFGRLVYESFRRQKRRKLLAGVAITLGVGVATAMLAVATDIGDKISRELRNQYVLGYYAGNQDRDGKWHKLKVRLSGRASAAKLQLYSKRGYYAGAQ